MVLTECDRSGSEVNPKPSSSLVGMLTKIWQRVLQRSCIGVGDNFFDIGGSAAAADTLFAEITRECGKELPSATIYHAQTIAALAGLMERPVLPRFSPFVQMKAGAATPPIFIAHGLSGSVQFFELAGRIQTAQPVYAIQAKGIDGLEEPFDRIEDMAEYYLESITELQPHGPYILIGYSFGGLVALEMAQRLAEQGEKIALLAMVDAYPHPRYMPVGQRLRLIAQRSRRRISEIIRRPSRDAIEYVASGLERRLQTAGVRRPGDRTASASRLSLAETISRVKEKAYVALTQYRPRPYSGKINFVKSEHDTYFPGDPAGVWSNLAAEFEVDIVPGSHLDMVTTHFESLAAVITGYVREVQHRE
jgi:acetoacetyl-CoA synthetase